MNGTSGFHELRSSISRSSTNRLLQEQQRQFGTGLWHDLRPHDLSDLFTSISTKRDTAPDTFLSFPSCLHRERPDMGHL